MSKKKEEIDELIAVVNIKIGENDYIVPIDNWNKAVEEGRTKPVILGNELHFFNEDEWNKLKLFYNKNI
jgi:hypothetical protein